MSSLLRLPSAAGKLLLRALRPRCRSISRAASASTYDRTAAAVPQHCTRLLGPRPYQRSVQHQMPSRSFSAATAQTGPGFATPSRTPWSNSMSTFALFSSAAYQQLRVRAPVGLSARSLFIRTDATPNPNSLKFIPGKEVLPEEYGNSKDFKSFEATSASPLARRLFRVDGVSNVYLTNEYVAVTREDESFDWEEVKNEVFASIMDHYAVGDPVVTDEPQVSDTTIFDDDSEVVAMIKELLETRIRPAVQDDGGDILYSGFDEESGIVSLTLAGSCSGCPSSEVTLKNGVENMLMHYIPEVRGIEQVGATD